MLAGFLFAAFDEAGRPIGFAGGGEVESWLHIAELDVDPDWQRQGIGRQLVQALLNEGRSRGQMGATLKTDRLVPFNAPFYASLGFHATHGGYGPPHLLALLASDKASSHRPDRRIAMLHDFSEVPFTFSA